MAERNWRMVQLLWVEDSARNYAKHLDEVQHLDVQRLDLKLNRKDRLSYKVRMPELRDETGIARFLARSEFCQCDSLKDALHWKKRFRERITRISDWMREMGEYLETHLVKTEEEENRLANAIRAKKAERQDLDSKIMLYLNTQISEFSVGTNQNNRRSKV